MSTIVCRECQQAKQHKAQGLCARCYVRARRIRSGIRVQCAKPGCPAFSALPALGICRGHITNELAGLKNKDFEARIAEMFAGKFTVVDECWEYNGTRIANGYGWIQLSADGQKQQVLVHRLVVQLRAGRPLTAFALHRCDNPPCFRPSHLYEGSHADNVADAMNRGRIKKGERHPRAKLNPEQVREILARHRPGVNRWDRGNTALLAQEFGVSMNMITSITREEHWSLGRSA